MCERKERNDMKKLFAILMSIMMIACFMPTMAFAAAVTVTVTVGDNAHITHDNQSGALTQNVDGKEITDIVCNFAVILKLNNKTR